MIFSPKIFVLFLLIVSSTAFFSFHPNKNYLFHYKSDTSGIKNWFTLNQTVETDVQVRKILNDTLFVQLDNVKIVDEIDKPHADEITEMSFPFLVVLGNNSFQFLTKDKTFVYCLKTKYRIVGLLLSDMSRFMKFVQNENPSNKVFVENLAFGNCEAQLKVAKNKENEVKVGVKAEYKDCHDDGRVNLATIFNLSPNSTTAAIVTVAKKKLVKKINTLSDMMTYNMGGLHLKIRSSLTYKGKTEGGKNEGIEDYRTIYTKDELKGFIQDVNK